MRDSDIAPLQVTAEIRALDTGPVPERVWRLTRGVNPLELALLAHLPWEEKRPVEVELLLPEEDAPLVLTGVIVRGEKYDRVRFVRLDETQDERLQLYTQTRRAEVFR